MKKTLAAALAFSFLFAPARGTSQDVLPDLEPLRIVAPRLKIPRAAVIDPAINMHLLRLLQQRMDARPDTLAAQDASVGNLVKLTTATGYKLKTRYTELGFLLTEGLAGVQDLALTNELERAVRQGTNVQTRAAAMAALAYTRDPRYLNLFQGALIDPNVTVRFGAVESLLILNDPSVRFLVSNAAREDRSPALRIYAAAGLWRMGDPNGREILLRLYQDNDWFTRALSAQYLGEMGGAEDYRKLMLQLGTEQNPQVKAELCSALLRLQRFKN